MATLLDDHNSCAGNDDHHQSDVRSVVEDNAGVRSFSVLVHIFNTGILFCNRTSSFLRSYRANSRSPVSIIKVLSNGIGNALGQVINCKSIAVLQLNGMSNTAINSPSLSVAIFYNSGTNVISRGLAG